MNWKLAGAGELGRAKRSGLGSFHSLQVPLHDVQVLSACQPTGFLGWSHEMCTMMVPVLQMEKLGQATGPGAESLGRTRT